MVLLARKDEEGNTHVSGEHLGVKRKRFLKRIIATTDFCNYQSRFIAYK